MNIILVFVSLVLPTSICMPVPVPLTRDRALTYFLAMALPDTALAIAGPGPTRSTREFMSASTPPGLVGRPNPNAHVFGQLVTIDRIGGFRADTLQRLLAREKRQAILIPWGYQADCSPILWQESARWINPGAIGFVIAQLRSERDWVDGRPTFDVAEAWHQPYPQGRFLKYDRPRQGANTELTAPELWDLYETLPSPDSLDSDPNRAIEPTRAWARSHPVESTRWPAIQILELLESMAKNHGR